ncbi:MAG: hypothetical protein IH599_06370 [Bacteroidales bacterium]|nr:hypothetical protein [Bacteroidales bacterium]
MLKAIRKSDASLVSGHLIRKRTAEVYLCPECGEEVIHARSLSGVRIGHFRHKAGSLACQFAGEGPEHERIKAEIYLYLQERYPAAFDVLEPEYRQLSPDLRPDLFLVTRKGTRIAIEIQVSSIRVDEMVRRMKEYTRLQVYMMWVLPFPGDRLILEKEELGWTHGIGHYVRSIHNETAHVLRLSEQEVFLYWAYFKKLIFWPGPGAADKGFILARLEEAYSGGREMLIEGEHRKYQESKSSMIKYIRSLEYGLAFDAFRPGFARAFRSRMRPYPIPARLILSIRD